MKKIPYKGVCFHKMAQKFQAQIQVNGKRKHLGLFRVPEAAALAYNQAAIKYHGEFSLLNEITVKSA